MGTVMLACQSPAATLGMRRVMRTCRSPAATLGMGRVMRACRSPATALGMGSVSRAFQNRVEALGNGAFMQKSLLGPVEYNGCLLDSSSDSGESDAHILKSLCSDSGENGEGMPKVCFLVGGRDSMQKIRILSQHLHNLDCYLLTF